MARDPLQDLARRDRAILLAGLTGIAGAAWACIVGMGSRMEGAHSYHAVTLPHLRPWGAREALAAFAMWLVMTGAMMLPLVTPWILLLSGASREKDPRPAPFGAAGFFLLGYLAVWAGYGALATLGQWALHEAALLSPMSVAMSPLLGGALLLAAGVYQWTPLRDACLAHCRSPMGFFLSSWRTGHRGASTMGFRHGLYCVGCCFALMALSFVFGVMDLLWMAGLTAFLLLEKGTSWGRRLGRAGGLLLAGLGLWMLASALPGG